MLMEVDWAGGGLGGFAKEGDEDALDDELGGGDEVWEGGVLSLEVGLPAGGDVALEGGLAIDECGDDVVVAGDAFLEDDGIAIADVGIDHGFATDFQGEGLGVAGDAEGLDVDGEGAILVLGGAFGKACGDAAVDGDVTDFLAVERFGENDGTGFSGEALDYAFFLKGTEVAHGSGLAGEAEVVLDLAGGGDEAGGAAAFFQII